METEISAHFPCVDITPTFRKRVHQNELAKCLPAGRQAKNSYAEFVKSYYQKLIIVQ
ncbi:MAG: hypothetical protein NT026_01930 [Candidatus Staskawiczbacteria bacterium]|nr:hypothetical protein [Candidatus Staskawiczbacteria bacterium]